MKNKLTKLAFILDFLNKILLKKIAKKVPSIPSDTIKQVSWIVLGTCDLE